MASLYVELRSKQTARDVDLDAVRRALDAARPAAEWTMVTPPQVRPAREALPEALEATRWMPREVVLVSSQFDDEPDEAGAAAELASLVRGMIDVARTTTTDWRLGYCGGWVGIITPRGIDDAIAGWLTLLDGGDADTPPPGWTGPGGRRDEPWPDPGLYPACLEASWRAQPPWRVELLEVGPRPRGVLGKLRPWRARLVEQLPAVLRRGIRTRRDAEDEAAAWIRIGATVRVVEDDPPVPGEETGDEEL